MKSVYVMILLTSVALITSFVVFPFVLRFAKRHNIVDNPDARKLQRVPIPLLGGLVVFCGVLAGDLTLSLLLFWPAMAISMLAMTIMLIVGTWDDIKGLSPVFRIIVEIIVIGGFILLTGNHINDFHGLWGIHELPDAVGILLSIVAGVGIINAVNLIDGVDGYASGYGMMACFFFSLMFGTVWAPRIMCLNLIVMGALFPFFLHNVFGIKTKMFIGDGGTLMLGTLMAILVFCALMSGNRCSLLERKGVGLLAFTLAVLCIPVFDTLRVMTARMLRGKSPFSPDKTHLHHLFIDMGFSHLGAAASILSMNLLIIVVWFVLWRSGASIDVQTYAVVLMGLLVTAGLYKVMKMQQNGGALDEEGQPSGTWLWHAACRVGEFSHFEKGKVWKMMTKIMDYRLFR